MSEYKILHKRARNPLNDMPTRAYQAYVKRRLFGIIAWWCPIGFPHRASKDAEQEVYAHRMHTAPFNPPKFISFKD